MSDLREQVEELGDVRGRLNALWPPSHDDSAAQLEKAARQVEANTREAAIVRVREELLRELKGRLQDTLGAYAGRLGESAVVASSTNGDIMDAVDRALREAVSEIEQHVAIACDATDLAWERVKEVGARLADRHVEQTAAHLRLVELNESASAAVRERIAAEQAVKRLEALEDRLKRAGDELVGLLARRTELKATFVLERERLSGLRETIAAQLQAEAGKAVRIRVIRNAYDLTYRQLLADGLRGAHLKNHEALLDVLSGIRPEQLAQILRDEDCDELEHLARIGPERCRKVVDAFHEKMDPLQVEIVGIDDRVCIELNTGTAEDPSFKDASELSRGQKCTALLPLLLARRDVPLIIDQPEDNLDNHFIYETVVETVRRVKKRRQMLLITHNANIPVLGEAELVIVMNSDGKRGYVERHGSLDDCRDEIIDLLEGGREAFELRRKRYEG